MAFLCGAVCPITQRVCYTPEIQGPPINGFIRNNSRISFEMTLHKTDVCIGRKAQIHRIDLVMREKINESPLIRICN